MKQYSYFIQIGTWPHNVTFACASEPIYHTADEASVAAFDYLTKVRGIDPGEVSTKWIHTRSVKLPKAVRNIHDLMRYRPLTGIARAEQAVILANKRRDRARDNMPTTMCGKKRHQFTIMTTREVD